MTLTPSFLLVFNISVTYNTVPAIHGRLQIVQHSVKKTMKLAQAYFAFQCARKIDEVYGGDVTHVKQVRDLGTLTSRHIRKVILPRQLLLVKITDDWRRRGARQEIYYWRGFRLLSKST